MRRRLKRLARRHPGEDWLIQEAGPNAAYKVNRSRLRFCHPQIFESKAPGLADFEEIRTAVRENRKDVIALRKAFRATSHAHLSGATGIDKG